MKELYTHNILNEFFEEFKNLPHSYKIEQVHLLLNNPYATATHKVNTHFKHLKLIIMTSAFIIGVSAILIWLTPDNSVNDNNISENQRVVMNSSVKNELIDKSQTLNIDSQNNETSIVKKPVKKLFSKKLNSYESEINIIDSEKAIANTITKDTISYWSCDTTINKEVMFVRLTPEELVKIGVIVKGEKSHYHNITPSGNYDMEMTSLPENERIITNNDYYAWAFSSLSCDEFTLGDPQFYSVIDTLVPVIVEAEKTKIYWFTPTVSLLEALPDRYSYLKGILDNLKYLKTTCPDKNFVNYWSQGESVFDRISFIELSKTELENIGFKISEKMIVLSDKNDINRIVLHSNSGVSSKGVSSKLSFPPNPFPMAITDEIGRRRYFTAMYVKDESVDRNYLMQKINTLIPVKVNLQEIIPPREETLVFWFYPTDEFVDALPNRIKYELKSELNAIQNESVNSTSTCKYFEVCKSTLDINDLNVYPNPASNNITIEFSLPQETVGSISLINISGIQVKSIVSKGNFNSGLNSFDENLSDVSPGVYLITITTPNGFKTQRIIISR